MTSYTINAHSKGFQEVYSVDIRQSFPLCNTKATYRHQDYGSNSWHRSHYPPGILNHQIGDGYGETVSPNADN